MIIAGLDLSINSTGVCIYDTIKNTTKYYIISSKFTKKALSLNHSSLSLITCEKNVVDSKKEYTEKEQVKTTNIYNIVKSIESVLLVHRVDAVCIEGISFGSVGSAALIDLSGLNYMVRLMAMENNIKHIYIVSPTQNKKFATGNGSAEKDVMISAWLKLQKHMAEVQSYVKTDDIADAYFLARYGASLLSA